MERPHNNETKYMMWLDSGSKKKDLLRTVFTWLGTFWNKSSVLMYYYVTINIDNSYVE